MAIRTINLTAGNDVYTDGNVASRINGKAGNDTIKGRGGNDQIYAGPGADNIDGGPGADYLDGGPADYPNSTTVLGGAGPDRIVIRSEYDNASGGQGDDYIVVQAGFAAGDESIFKGVVHAGKDTLFTQLAVNPGLWRIVEGGGGADLFVVDYHTGIGGSGSIMIRDFDPGLDKIALYSSGIGGTVPTNGTITFARFDTNQDGKIDASDPASIFGNVTFNPGDPDPEYGWLPYLRVEFAQGGALEVLSAHELQASDFSF